MSDSEIPRDDSDGPGHMALPFSSSYHAPVLCKAVVDGLVTKRDGLYVDGTAGGGGHSAALLDALEDRGTLIAIDRDSEAIEAIRSRLTAEVQAGRLITAQDTFSNVGAVLDRLGLDAIDGMLLDLGVSSHQFDTARRGFSHRFAGPLDMRMDDRDATRAADMMNDWEVGDIARVLRIHGEEPRARAIARNVANARPLASTGDLVEVIRATVPDRDVSKTLARVFQAIRIEINDEIGELERVLSVAAERVRVGGRIAVISYHSLEDRRVKRFLRYGNLEGRPHRTIKGDLITPWKPLSRKPIAPTDEEILANPRARSARLRIAERIEPDRP